MNQRIVLVGAGSAQFGFGTIGEILQSPILRSSTIVLHDINGEALKKVDRAARDFVEQQKLPFSVESTTSDTSSRTARRWTCCSRSSANTTSGAA